MSAPMSIGLFAELMQHVFKFHGMISPGHKQGTRRVKYVDPHIDMRDGAVFAVTFRGCGSDKTFHTQNEQVDNPLSLNERIFRWLKGEDID